jgi:hypothetical protein
METRARGVYVHGYYASMLKNKSVRVSVQARRIGRRCQLSPSEFNQLKNKINLTVLKNLKTKTATSTVAETINLTKKETSFLQTKFQVVTGFISMTDFLECFNIETERYFETFNQFKNYCRLSNLRVKTRKNSTFSYLDKHFKCQKINTGHALIVVFDKTNVVEKK